MAHQLESLLPDCYYHIYNHANGSDNIFRQEENYYYFLEKYSQYIFPIADTFAYCLMPNHFHFFIRIKSLNQLQPLQGLKTLEGVNEDVKQDPSKYISQQFSNLFNGYTQAYNKRFDRKGSLFIPRFKRKKVETTEYFIQLIKYIHLNPVTHGFVKDLNDWKYSSYHSFIGNKTSKVKFEEALDWFESVPHFKYLHTIPIDEKFILDMEL